MDNDQPIDPRLDAATTAFVMVQKAPFYYDSMSAALAAADAYDAERGIVRVHQSSIDNDAARIAAAQRAGQEIREALRLPATATWQSVLWAASIFRRGWIVQFYKTNDGLWVAVDRNGWITGAWPTLTEAAAAVESRVK